MQPLYYASSRHKYPIFTKALFDLDEMGLTAQWYAENYASNLRAIQLEIDMGMHPSFEIRKPEANEHPLVPIAELFREMMLKPPYHPQLLGIPCEWPKGYVSHLLTTTDVDLKREYRDSVVELASSRKEDLYYYYLNGCTENIGHIDFITSEQIDLLIMGNPWSVFLIDHSCMTQRHWDLALKLDVNILRENDISLFSKETIQLMCKNHPTIFRIVTLEKGLSLLDLKFEHRELVEAAMTQDFVVSDHDDVFSLDEMITIIASNRNNWTHGQLISKYPSQAEKIFSAFKYDEERTHNMIKHTPIEVIVDMLYKNKLTVKDIPRVIYTSIEKLDPALSVKVQRHGRDDDAFDVPF